MLRLKEERANVRKREKEREKWMTCWVYRAMGVGERRRCCPFCVFVWLYMVPLTRASKILLSYNALLFSFFFFLEKILLYCLIERLGPDEGLIYYTLYKNRVWFIFGALLEYSHIFIKWTRPGDIISVPLSIVARWINLYFE